MQPGIGGEVIPHQDSAFLFTDPMRLVCFWIALEDATLENGCLWFIPGSYKLGERRMVRNHKKEPGQSGIVFRGEKNSKHNDDDFVDGPVKKGHFFVACTMVLIREKVVHRSERNTSPDSHHIYTFHMFDQKDTHYSEENCTPHLVCRSPHEISEQCLNLSSELNDAHGHFHCGNSQRCPERSVLQSFLSNRQTSNLHSGSEADLFYLEMVDVSRL
ncbi:hypothetical protein DPMN_154755 [Dreissena polymorpha]|uniref:Uncharacterized protein n=1 Tax=Dreissena polymorpha TaxID=45954 RepID=A0A9D4J796_DREPO|nr:hypothetical protein DPMN_154755 [Dreissena polymorpha]